MAQTNRKPSRSAQKPRLKASVRKPVEDYLNHLREQGLSIQKAFIFGSHTNGKTHEWSDIDVCVVSPDFSSRKDPLIFLWRALRAQDVKAGIEPVGFHPADFVEDFPIVHEILRHGVEII
jgi:predicted nucleotidyltransferase